MRIFLEKTVQYLRQLIKPLILLFILRKKSTIINMKKIKKRMSIPELHSNILDMFGYPVSSIDCLCKRDKIMYVYGYMMVVKATDDEPEILADSLFEKDPAEYFCFHYYNKNKKHVIRDGIEDDIKIATADKINENKKLDKSGSGDKS